MTESLRWPGDQLQHTKRQMVSAICSCMESLDGVVVVSVCLSVCLCLCLPLFHLSANFAGLPTNFLSRYLKFSASS